VLPERTVAEKGEPEMGSFVVIGSRVSRGTEGGTWAGLLGEKRKGRSRNKEKRKPGLIAGRAGPSVNHNMYLTEEENYPRKRPTRGTSEMTVRPG